MYLAYRVRFVSLAVSYTELLKLFNNLEGKAKIDRIRTSKKRPYFPLNIFKDSKVV